MNMHLDIDPTTANIITFILIVLLSVCVIGTITLAFLCFAESTDFYSKKISKNIAKGNIYKAVMLYEKYNPLDFYYDNLKEDDFNKDDFNKFVNVFYSYMKDKINFDRSLLIYFLNHYTRVHYVSTYYELREDFKKYLDKEIELMKFYINPAENSGNWCPNDSEIADRFLILLLQDYGFVKFKNGKDTDVCSLLLERKYDELFETMDDCKLKDIIVNVKKYDEYQACNNSCRYIWKNNEWCPIG